MYLTREARLRPEHAEQHPDLEPDIWQSAEEVYDRVLQHQPAGGAGAREGTDRILPNEHFEFRGGFPRGPHAALRTRADDPDDLN